MACQEKQITNNLGFKSAIQKAELEKTLKMEAAQQSNELLITKHITAKDK